VKKATWIVGATLRLYINSNSMAFQALSQLIGNSADTENNHINGIDCGCHYFTYNHFR
jgi:hypothetical protein